MSTDIKLVDIHYNDHSGKVWKTFADPNQCNIDTFVEMVKIDTRSRWVAQLYTRASRTNTGSCTVSPGSNTGFEVASPSGKP